MFSGIVAWFDRPWKIGVALGAALGLGYGLHRWKGPSIDKALDKVWHAIAHPGETWKKFREGSAKKEGGGNPQ